MSDSKKSDVKILMLGGRRCGKSSILASMDHLLRNDKSLLECAKIWNSGEDDVIIDKPLDKKQNDLVDFVENNRKSDSFLVDFNADKGISRYFFKMKEKDTKNFMTIEFVDPHGESYAPQSPDHMLVKAEINSTDVFVVAIDTPYLMGTELGKAKDVNQVQRITDLFKDIVFDGDKDYKKVIFIPVKCERWRDDLDSVKVRFEKLYSELLMNLEESQYSILFLPVFTAGGIEFSEFSDPQIIAPSDINCKQLGNSTMVRCANGETRALADNETVKKNEEFLDGGIPYYSWFTIKGDYKPVNCEQIVYHILRFLLFKTKANTNSFFNFFGAIFMGSITISSMEKIMEGINKFIKNSGNGISNIKLLEK